MANTEQEIWKTYPDYPFIQANQFGEIRTIDRYVPSRNGSKRLVKGRVLKQQLGNSGYMYVQFSVDGKKVRLSVHRVVATSHLPNPDNLQEVNHIDCDPTNNRRENLEWCTHQENVAYCVKLGHHVNNNPGQPVIAVDLNSFKVFWFESQMEAARQLGVWAESINRVIKGKRHKAGGCWFCYADSSAIEKVRAKFGDELANKVEKLMNEHRN